MKVTLSQVCALQLRHCDWVGQYSSSIHNERILLLVHLGFRQLPVFAHQLGQVVGDRHVEAVDGTATEVRTGRGERLEVDQRA